MKEKFRTTQIIHLALCIGLILAYVVVGGMDALTSFKFSNMETMDIVYVAVPFLAIFLSNFLFKNQLKAVDPSRTLEEKWPVYQTASVVRWAVLEGAAFFLLFVGNDFMLLGVLIILYMIYIRPTLDKMKMDLS